MQSSSLTLLRFREGVLAALLSPHLLSAGAAARLRAGPAVGPLTAAKGATRAPVARLLQEQQREHVCFVAGLGRGMHARNMRRLWGGARCAPAH